MIRLTGFQLSIADAIVIPSLLEAFRVGGQSRAWPPVRWLSARAGGVSTHVSAATNPRKNSARLAGLLVRKTCPTNC